MVAGKLGVTLTGPKGTQAMVFSMNFMGGVVNSKVVIVIAISHQFCEGPSCSFKGDGKENTSSLCKLGWAW